MADDGFEQVERPAPPSASRLSRSMTPLLAALTAALIALGVLLAQTFASEREARARGVRETERLFAYQQVLQTTVDAETGQRGYLLTARPEYLLPFGEAQARVEAERAALRAMVRGASEDEAVRLARADRLIGNKFTEMARTIELARSGERKRAQELVMTDVGRRQMRQVRADITWLIANETRRRGAAFERVVTIERRVLILAVVLGATILALVVLGFRAERGRAQGAAEAAQAAALRDANARARLLTRELNHRVKNLFSVILAIVSLSGRKQAPAREVVEDIRARIRALSLAHTVSQGAVSDATVMLGDVIARTMEPYGDDSGSRIRIAGPPQELVVRAVTPVGLIIHELATNAVKYGALSTEAGQVEITWSVRGDADGDDAEGGDANERDRSASAGGTGRQGSSVRCGKEIRLTWIETGGPALTILPAVSAKQGYGSQMIGLAASQLGGRIDREWAEAGAIVRLSFPLTSPDAGEHAPV